MLVPDTRAADVPPPRPAVGWQAIVVLLAIVAAFAAGLLLGGEVASFVFAGLTVLPFAVMAFFAYLGTAFLWARVLAVLWLGGLFLVVGILVFAASLGGLMAQAGTATGEDFALPPGGEIRMLIIAIGIGAAAVLALYYLWSGADSALGRRLGLDPTSFVHRIALATVVSLSILSLLPLLVIGEPPLLLGVAEEGGPDIAIEDAGALLRADLYGLVWIIPSTVVAVGYGVRRSLRQSLARLGFVWPTLREVYLGLGVALALVVAAAAVGEGIDWLWRALGWATTDTEAFEILTAPYYSPVGALVVGVTAGLGEELAVRGVLQPRLGILVSNIFFTALHAFQYNWDGLLSVFLLGVALGLLRRRTNTTTSAIAHGVYDLVLVLGVAFQVPGLS